jgi:UDP-N-acetylmuramate: L-alanyl-gamma-D-glutamyl-meso-diaminopimelate ligase
VIVAAAHLPGKVPERDRISESELVRAISELGKEARFVPAVDDIVALLADELREGDRVVVLSNGGFGGIHDKLLRALDGGAGAVPAR